MFIPVVLAVCMFWAMGALFMGSAALESFHRADAQIHTNNIAVISKAIADMANEQPASLYATGEYEYPGPGKLLDTDSTQWQHLKFRDLERYEHATGRFRSQTSAGLTTGIVEQRMAVWLESPRHSFFGDKYLEQNPCAMSGDTAEKLDSKRWCGTPHSLWAKIESGTAAIVQIEAEQQRLYRTTRKFYRYYGAERTFAHLGSLLGEGVTGQPLVFFTKNPSSLTAQNCTGTQWTNTSPAIPLDCNDLFNAWEAPVWLHIVANNQAILTNVLGIDHQAQGEAMKPVRLAENIHIKPI